MSLYTPIWMAEPTLSSRILCWGGIAANVLLVVWCAIWVKYHGSHLEIGLGWVVILIGTAIYLADLFSGFVHWLTDTWFNELSLNGVVERIVSIAREHHLYPHQIVGYGFRDYTAYSSWPNVAIVGPIALALTLFADPTPAVFAVVIVCLVISAIMIFGTYAHRLGHRNSKWRIIRILQRYHLLITPPYHAIHHCGNHDIRYCVINGWANPFCDHIKLWRGLEWIIQQITGARARQNDDEWFDKYERDPDFRSARRIPTKTASVERGGSFSL